MIYVWAVLSKAENSAHTIPKVQVVCKCTSLELNDSVKIRSIRSALNCNAAVSCRSVQTLTQQHTPQHDADRHGPIRGCIRTKAHRSVPFCWLAGQITISLRRSGTGLLLLQAYLCGPAALRICKLHKLKTDCGKSATVKIFNLCTAVCPACRSRRWCTGWAYAGPHVCRSTHVHTQGPFCVSATPIQGRKICKCTKLSTPSELNSMANGKDIYQVSHKRLYIYVT